MSNKVQRIITLCPHGYNTFAHEYPSLLPLLTDLPQEGIGDRESRPHQLRAGEVRDESQRSFARFARTR